MTAGYRLIPLSGARGICALARVDEADYDSLVRYRWHVIGDGYAARSARPARRGTEYMHRHILGLAAPDTGQGDHINGNKLDNRRANLRVVTDAGNAQNRRSHLNSTSVHRGVWRTRNGRWKADVMIDGRRHALGCYSTPEEASVVASRFRAEHMPLSQDARA